MASSFVDRKPRRLPVYFLLDTSREMAGTFEVTMQQGLLIVRNELAKHELSQHELFYQCVHFSEITFGETASFHYFAPALSFTPLGWQARGQSKLQPALAYLVESLTYDLIVSRPERPGDYAPLVFLILGGRPVDTWQKEYAALTAFTDNRRPRIVTLVTRAELAQEMKAISHHVLLLNPATGEYMTAFFYWIARTIIKMCEDYDQGITASKFPGLPYGVALLR